MLENIRGKKYFYIGSVYSFLTGQEVMALSSYWGSQIKVVDNSDAFYFVSDNELKEIEVKKEEPKKNKVDDLIKLKAEFTTDEILRLNGEGLL